MLKINGYSVSFYGFIPPTRVQDDFVYIDEEEDIKYHLLVTDTNTDAKYLIALWDKPVPTNGSTAIGSEGYMTVERVNSFQPEYVPVAPIYLNADIFDENGILVYSGEGRVRDEIDNAVFIYSRYGGKCHDEADWSLGYAGVRTDLFRKA